MPVWFLKWFLDTQNLSVWFLEWQFWFKNLSVPSLKWLLISKLFSAWFLNDFFYFQNVSVRCLKWHSWFTKYGDSCIPAWHPTVLRWSAHLNILFSEQNNIATKDKEGVYVPWKLYHWHPTHRFGACQKFNFMLMEGKKVTWHKSTTTIWFPLASVADSLNHRDFVTRLAAKQASCHWSSLTTLRTTCPQTACC